MLVVLRVEEVTAGYHADKPFIPLPLLVVVDRLDGSDWHGALARFHQLRPLGHAARDGDQGNGVLSGTVKVVALPVPGHLV